jgi:hypothetical protein
MYASVARERSLSNVALFSTPGISQLADTGEVLPGRGAVVMEGVYYVVVGLKLFEIDEFGAETLRGAIPGTKRVSMAHNGEQLVIVVPGGNSFVYNATTTTLTQITDGDFRTSDSVCFKDGFYIFTETDSNVFFNSALNDPLTFDALDFGTAELAPGNIVGCHVKFDELFILKKDNTEVFQNIGGADFPFQRIPGASFEKGTHSRYSPIQWEGAFYFVGGGVNEKTSVFMAGGSAEPINISNDAIDQEIQKFTDTEIADSFSFSYSLSGFSFRGFTFRSINTTPRTFVYNVTASRLLGEATWHEQQTGIADGSWRVNSVDFVYNKLLVSDNESGIIGILDPDVFTEYGTTILRSRTTGPIAGNGLPLYVNFLELTTNSGTGTISGQGLDPKVMMDYSDDGARTFSSEFWRPLGKIGEYFRRSVWRRLGRVPAHRVWRFKVSDPVRVAFIKLEGEVKSGR